MDRPMFRTDAGARGPGRAADARDAFVLPSRRPALDLVRDSLEAGPILLTGEAGVGKTWLWHQLADDDTPGRSWMEVDLTPADDPASFLRMVGHGLGLSGPGWSRSDLGDTLAELAADGGRRVLVIEEAHNLSPTVAEEVRVLANRLGRPDGLAGLVLVGQTSLARRMTTRPLSAIEARLSARAHLGPIDADEARELLARLRPSSVRTAREFEAAHRDSGGNPRRLLRASAAFLAPAETYRPGTVARVATRLSPPAEPAPAIAAPEPGPDPEPSRPAPLIGPDRPPLRVEDELIEVGWSPEAAQATRPDADTDAPGPARPGLGAMSPGDEEAVHDHYAALQAWREWSDNQGRRALAEASSRPSVDDEDHDPDPDPDANTTVWVDGQQDFAPFGQLFTKMARVRDPE